MSKGRTKILCDLIPTGNVEQDKIIIPLIISKTLALHEKNACEILRLKNNYYNETNILSKVKTQRADINNKIAVPYSSLITTTINAYCFANPFTFSGRTTGVEEKIKALNDALDDDKYSQKSQEMQLNSGITGLGYRYIVPATPQEIKNGIYFKTICSLKPENTYCVYANDLEQDKICAITFYDKAEYNEYGEQTNSYRLYTVFTKYHKWEFYKSGGEWVNSQFNVADVNGNLISIEAFPLSYQIIPIIENDRKADMTGDAELVLDLIDAVNALASARLDDVQQAVDYLFCLRDIDIWSDGALENVKTAIRDGILAFRSIQGATVQPEVDVLDTKLDQSQIQALQDFLCDKILEMTNIPNRETGTTGGDNGVAVEARNGTRSLENIAGLVNANALKTENETLEVILAIANNIESCPFKGLRVSDVQIKDNRNRAENLTTAANAYSIMRAAGMNDRDALIVSKLVPDAQATEERNKAEQEEKQQREQQIIRMQQQNNSTQQENIKNQNEEDNNNGND